MFAGELERRKAVAGLDRPVAMGFLQIMEQLMFNSLSSTTSTVFAIARSRRPCGRNGCGARGGYRGRWGISLTT